MAETKRDKLMRIRMEQEEKLKTQGKSDDLVEELQDRALEALEESSKNKSEVEDLKETKAEEPGKAIDLSTENDSAASKNVRQSSKREARPREKGYKGLLPSQYVRGAVKTTSEMHVMITEATEIELAKRLAGKKGKTKQLFALQSLDAFLELKQNTYDKLIAAAESRKVTIGTILNEALSKYLDESGIETLIKEDDEDGEE